MRIDEELGDYRGMADDDVMVLGAANLQRRSRTSKSGVKTRYTVEVKGDSLLINADPKSLGKAPAEAIVATLREKMRAITAVASPATQRFREASAKAVAEGKAYALKRYGGGKTGTKAPNQSNRLFNDSGRFIEGLIANANGQGWTINMPSNRLSPDTLSGGEGALVRIYRRLIDLVPEFGDTRKLLESSKVVKALEGGIKDMIQVAGERTAQLKKARMQAGINAARALMSLVA